MTLPPEETELEIAARLRGHFVDDVLEEIRKAEWRRVYAVIDGDCRLTGEVVDAADKSRDWRLRIGRDGWTQLIDSQVAAAAGWHVGVVVAKKSQPP